MAAFIQQFTMCFGLLLVAAYLVPAGVLHWIVALRPTSGIEAARLQARRPRAEDVRREVRQSLAALALFALYSVALLAAYRAGRTSVYWTPSDYPLWWAPLSVVVAMVLHDTLFYWTHRVMHLPWIFQWLHAGHHRSITPTAWAMLSFQPLETVPQFAFFALLAVFVPMHPVALLS
jgi:lathosterol oxidase